MRVTISESSGLTERRAHRVERSLRPSATGIQAVGLKLITQVLSRINGFSRAEWAFHFLTSKGKLGFRGEHIVREISLLPYLGMSKTCVTILAVDNPSRIGIGLAHWC
jgi:hypothetical protein